MITRQFDARKALEVLLYIAGRCPNLYTTLKVLYIADKMHLDDYGRQICNETYCRMPHGPVASNLYDMIKHVRGDGWSPFGNESKIAFRMASTRTITPLRDANTDLLSESDMECLDAAIEKCEQLSFSQLKSITHDDAFNATSLDHFISLEEIVRTLPDSELLLEYLETF